MIFMVKKRAFSFHSGGRYHFQGFGEWIFSLDEKGEVHVEQHVADQKKGEKNFSLSNNECVNLWNNIDSIPFPTLKGSDRPGMPDEAQYLFVLDDGSRRFEIKIWANDIPHQKEIKQLVDVIKEILVKYSKKKVVI